MNQTTTVEIGRLFDTIDTCHFTFSVDDQVSAEDLDPYNQKYMQIYIDKFDGLDIYISNGTNSISTTYTQGVNWYNRNFTIAPTAKMFVQLNPSNNTEYGDYSGKITFRYYTWSPNCEEFTQWNGTECVPDFEAFCVSLTDTMINKTETPWLRVYWNGTKCAIGTTINLEDVFRPAVAQPPPLPDARQRSTKFYKDYMSRSPQYSSILMVVFLLAGLCIFKSYPILKAKYERLRFIYSNDPENDEELILAKDSSFGDDISELAEEHIKQATF